MISFAVVSLLSIRYYVNCSYLSLYCNKEWRQECSLRRLSIPIGELRYGLLSIGTTTIPLSNSSDGGL